MLSVEKVKKIKALGLKYPSYHSDFYQKMSKFLDFATSLEKVLIFLILDPEPIPCYSHAIMHLLIIKEPVILN